MKVKSATTIATLAGGPLNTTIDACYPKYIHCDFTANVCPGHLYRKLSDTPFPFPWAQFILVLLLLHTATSPLVVLAYIPHVALALVMSAIITATYWALNEVRD